MVSLYYSSNQKKRQVYNAEDRLREVNQEQQQQILDDLFNKERGIEEQATNLGRLGQRVINKLMTADPPQIVKNGILQDAIKKGYLSDLFKVIKTMTGKNKAEQDVIDNLKNKEILEKTNKENERAQSVEEILNNVLNNVANEVGQKEALNNLIDQASQTDISGKIGRKSGPKTGSKNKPKNYIEMAFNKDKEYNKLKENVEKALYEKRILEEKKQLTPNEKIKLKKINDSLEISNKKLENDEMTAIKKYRNY